MNKQIKTAVIIVLAVVVGAFGVLHLFARPKFDDLVGRVKGNTGGAASPPNTGGGNVTTPTPSPAPPLPAPPAPAPVGGAVQYPVTVRSSPSAILNAFNASGYMESLRNAVTGGSYPQSYLTDAQNNPASWLASHPYLYDAYPAYFAR